jgi:hypothetical protein
VDCRRNSPGRSALSEDAYGVAVANLLPAVRRKAAQPRRIRHLKRMEPMHRTAALDSRSMVAAVTRGSR